MTEQELKKIERAYNEAFLNEPEPTVEEILEHHAKKAAAFAKTKQKQNEAYTTWCKRTGIPIKDRRIGN